jgi:acetyl-CoA carboxylase biotin carboxyl carrier protein
MDFEKIRGIIELFNESKANYLELEDDGFYLKLQDKPEKIIQSAQVMPQQVATPVAQANVLEQNNTTDTTEKSTSGDDYHVVNSPMVGTFYRAPSPDSDPFAEVGSKVKKGETLCIIEAMKLMNEIESDAGGEIVKILVENGEPVEYNQPLFFIKPD